MQPVKPEILKHLELVIEYLWKEEQKSFIEETVRISAKSDTCFGKYSDSHFGLNSDTFRSGATPGQKS